MVNPASKLTIYSKHFTKLDYQVDLNLLNKLLLKQSWDQPPFFKEEFKSAIFKCNNLSISGPDCISQKLVIKNDKCLTNIVNIANMCINLDLQSMYFKTSSFIIIPKPNKTNHFFEYIGKIYQKSYWQQNSTSSYFIKLCTPK